MLICIQILSFRFHLCRRCPHCKTDNNYWRSSKSNCKWSYIHDFI